MVLPNGYEITIKHLKNLYKTVEITKFVKYLLQTFDKIQQASVINILNINYVVMMSYYDSHNLHFRNINGRIMYESIVSKSKLQTKIHI